MEQGLPTGVKEEKSEAASNFGDNDSMMEFPDDLPDDIKIQRQEETISKINLDLEEKNSKIIDLLSENEEIKI